MFTWSNSYIDIIIKFSVVGNPECIVGYCLRRADSSFTLLQRGRNGEERLPLAPDNPANCASLLEDCRFFAGDVRNSEQAGLSSMHTLLVREHNRIAAELLRLNPQWYSLRNYDQKIYEVHVCD